MNEEFPELEPSEQAKIAMSANRFERKYNFPFATVSVGKSFAVRCDQVSSLDVLRTTASREGRKLNRLFRVFDHGEQGYEVFHYGSRTPVGSQGE